ncbi:MAG TPA: PAS domain S-box protein [Nocardioides sp.]|nr:PAS domain S-box protein [Nocardioides sp.]
MPVASGGTKPSVVLVDDSKEVRAVVRRLLLSSGFDVVGEGGDGDEAILLAFRHEPALLLLDTSMPKVDGIEALPAILALSPDTKVVMFTGFEEPGLVARARELGAADFIEKSLHLDDLPDRLMQALEGAGPPSAGQRPRVVPEHPARPQEQAVLSEHVQQFRELFDRAELGMATLTSSGTIVRANRALAALMSCSPDDLVGVDYGRLTVGQGDELDRRLEDISTLGEDLTSFEHDLPAPLGQETSRIVRVTLAPIRDTRQHVLYVFAQVQDVTAQRAVESDLRRSEENFRRLVTVVGEYAIFMLAVDGTVVSWNSGAHRIKGYLASEIVGRHFRVFYLPEEQESRHPEQNLEMALLQGSFTEEGWRVRKDGSRFWASVVITPVFDDTGHHVGYAKVTRDQTQQREHEEERRRFIEQRVHLLAVTAHELRNPTAVIDGSAGALLATWDVMSPEERDELLYGVRSSADRLRRLAADLAQASRSTGDTLPQRLEEVSLTDALLSAAARVQAAGTDVEIVTVVPDEAVFLADPGRLAQALDNLLDNAVRHGRPPIGLIGTATDHVCIRVTDAGPGVSSELEPRLFERFAVTGDSGGTGLGLYLVREIAQRHGGDVTYHPPSGDAPAAFEIALPRRPAART